MRKTLTALLLAASLPPLAFAAGDGFEPRPMHGDGHRGGHMMQELNLTPEQHRLMREQMRTQVKNQHEITQRYLDKLPAADKAAMQKELQDNRDKTNKAIRDKLTPEQQKQFDEMLQKIEERRAERAEFEAWKAERDKKAQ